MRIKMETILAYSAIVLSAISAVGVIWQTKVASDQREAAVWPYVQAFPNRFSKNPAFSISLTNAGVGPAVVRYFSVRVDDKPVKSWREFLAAVSEDKLVREADFDEGVIQGSGWVLAPNMPVSAFSTTVPEAVDALAPSTWSRIDVKFCYCSVFDQCWLSSWEVSKHENDPKPVTSCPAQAQSGFDWAGIASNPVKLKTAE